jgi:CO dehydrogenase/acetyl-CoA synthase beta subunit
MANNGEAGASTGGMALIGFLSLSVSYTFSPKLLLVLLITELIDD